MSRVIGDNLKNEYPVPQLKNLHSSMAAIAEHVPNFATL